MTDIESSIARVLELDAKATAGPWHIDSERPWAWPDGLDEPESYSGDVWPHKNVLGCAPVASCEMDRDAPLVGEYRTLAPLLARELEKCRAELDTARGLGELEREALETLRSRLASVEALAKRWERQNPAIDYGISQIRARELREALKASSEPPDE